MRLPRSTLSYLARKRNVDNQFAPYKNVSNYAYLHSTSNGKGSTERYNTMRRLEQQGYTRDDELTTPETSVFYNPDNNHVIVGYRGTKVNNPKDLISDFNIAIGKERRDQRFRESLDHFGLVKDKYDPSLHTIDVTGHSLGGALAKHVNLYNQDSVMRDINFNRGSTPLTVWGGKKFNNPRNMVDVSNYFDPISLGARLEDGDQMRVTDYTPLPTSAAHDLQNLPTGDSTSSRKRRGNPILNTLKNVGTGVLKGVANMGMGIAKDAGKSLLNDAKKGLTDVAKSAITGAATHAAMAMFV